MSLEMSKEELIQITNKSIHLLIFRLIFIKSVLFQ